MSSSTEPMGETKGSEPRSKFINTSLLSLKCLLFCFFGSMGCLVPFLPLHMLKVGLSEAEMRTVSMVAPVAGLLGPLLAGPLADRVAATRLRLQADKPATRPSNGRYLRVMIAVCCLFSALFYSLLLVVPVVRRIQLTDARKPNVSLSCDQHGAIVHQERCPDEIGCHRWTNEDVMGQLRLQSCRYECGPVNERRSRARSSVVLQDLSSAVLQDAALPEPGESSGELGVIPLETVSTTSTTSSPPKESRSLPVSGSEPPHVCFEQLFDGKASTVCHAFTESSLLSPNHSVAVTTSLRHALNPENGDEWCAYPLATGFYCRIPVELEREYARNNHSCLVECTLDSPYGDYGYDSLLSESQCRQTIGNEQLTFWMYLSIRCIADAFPSGALALIDAATVLATRETSTGRGDVGRQLAFGALGFAAFGSLSGYASSLLRQVDDERYLGAPLLLHALLALLAASVALCAEGMPLGPPEWWWHTRSGMLALPMSAVRRYGAESLALFLVLAVLGGFASVIDTYLPLHLQYLGGDELSIGVALTVGALPAVLFLWKSEHLVDYCGHSNLLITAFIMYIIRFTGLSLVPNVWWSLISEALELFTLEIMWVTAILYFRHLIPRQMTTTGQALPVIAHFCIGRAIGAVIGACVDKINRGDNVEAMRYIYQCMAIAAAAIASLYFVLYHGILKPRCHAQTVQSGHRQPPTIVQAMNGNGNYTPLRVYHNGMGRKGQFRY